MGEPVLFTQDIPHLSIYLSTHLLSLLSLPSLSPCLLSLSCLISLLPSPSLLSLSGGSSCTEVLAIVMFAVSNLFYIFLYLWRTEGYMKCSFILRLKGLLCLVSCSVGHLSVCQSTAPPDFLILPSAHTRGRGCLYGDKVSVSSWPSGFEPESGHFNSVAWKTNAN